MDYNESIIIAGGMGSLASLAFYERLLLAFPIAKESDRPRIIIDNYCTLPSRVRAILYNERKAELLDNITRSIAGLNELVGYKAYTVLCCNTMHYFLPKLQERLPKVRFLNIIDLLAQKLEDKDNLTVLATEGTIRTGLYPEYFSKYNIGCTYARDEVVQRKFIEGVKQHHLTAELIAEFRDYLLSFNTPIILGCTEFPILYQKILATYGDLGIPVYDPLEETISHLQKILH